MMDSIAFKTLERPRSPNTYLLAPEGLCEKAETDDISGVFEMSTGTMLKAILDLIDQETSWTLEAVNKAQGMVHFVSTSRLMRFKDDIYSLILPADADGASMHDHCRLAVYSSSRVGHSDLGANRKRVKYLLECLHKKQIRT
jgi:uncharacterized protein (DUF1499 family)